MSDPKPPAEKPAIVIVVASLLTDVAVVIAAGALAWHGVLDKTTVSTILCAMIVSRGVARAARERKGGGPPTGPTGGVVALALGFASYILPKKFGA